MSTSPGNAAESPDTPGFPPWIRLLRFIEGKRISQVIYALAELNVADQLIAGPRSVADLATAVNANPDALYRLLRVSSAVGVFREEPDGSFKHYALRVPANIERPRDAVAWTFGLAPAEYRPAVET